ncbi:MAG: hypothetical protein NXI30_04560 [bacterium]|nr:hypothetical protein [bacterium]
MKQAAAIVVALVPLAVAVVEYRHAKAAKSETVEVARVLSEACLRTNEVRP